ncbi:hypothetical protein K474DRAFT_1762582 [Panus rudis PR-1116 ss-1]|nr:hypothetical protein K474DRAFT_1762582 [Panus rudis PR-1116 ss-1]
MQSQTFILATIQCTFPVEMFETIVAAVLEDEDEFTAIANFSLASKAFREIALRRYFTRLYAHTKPAWINMCRIPGVYTWVREIDGLSIALCTAPANLLSFTYLRSLQIDLSPEGLNTQHTCLARLFNCLPPSASHSLTFLKLTYLPCVNVHLLKQIAKLFPELKTLELSCAERLIDDCCWECYEETSSGTIHSPIPDVYFEIDDLAYTFGAALKPLTKLEHLFLGIFLSELDIFHYHISNCGLRAMPIVPSNDIEATADDLEDNDMALWPYAPDECKHCQDSFGEDLRVTELFASASIARFFPNLTTVAWATFFARDEPGDEPKEKKTTAWVMRKNGKVKVRRAPWRVD